MLVSHQGFIKTRLIAFYLPCSHHASQRTFSTKMSGKEQFQFRLQAATNEFKITNA